MRVEIRMAGFGGQGVVTAGRLLAMALMRRNPNIYVVYTPTYGFVTRGTTAMSDVIISEEPIHYPKVMALDVLVALSPKSLEYTALLKDGATVIYDTTYVQEVSGLKPTVRAMPLPITRSIMHLGSTVYASIAALAVLTTVLPITMEDLEDAVRRYFPERYWKNNVEALRIGVRLVKDMSPQSVTK